MPGLRRTSSSSIASRLHNTGQIRDNDPLKAISGTQKTVTVAFSTGSKQSWILIGSMAMMLDAGETFEDIDDDGRRFLNVLAGHLKDNIVPNVYLDELKAEMEQEAIPLEKLDTLLEVMKRHMALEHHSIGGESWITIHPHKVRAIQYLLKENTCPQCKKWTLAQKVVIYCLSPDCNYHCDKKSQQKGS